MLMDLRDVVWLLDRYRKRLREEVEGDSGTGVESKRVRAELQRVMKAEGTLLQIVGKRKDFFLEACG